MKTLSLLLALTVLGASVQANARNPFEPPSSAKGKSAASPQQAQPAAAPLVLPPPAPPRAAPVPELPAPPAAEEPANSKAAKVRSKEPPVARAQAACNLKPKSAIVAAPAYGGPVTVHMVVSGGKECLSAVLAEKSWIEVKDLSDPAAVRVEVDPNDTGAPRQSSIILANTTDSVTVTLMQEGRAGRNK